MPGRPNDSSPAAHLVRPGEGLDDRQPDRRRWCRLLRPLHSAAHQSSNCSNMQIYKGFLDLAHLRTPHVEASICRCASREERAEFRNRGAGTHFDHDGHGDQRRAEVGLSKNII